MPQPVACTLARTKLTALSLYRAAILASIRRVCVRHHAATKEHGRVKGAGVSLGDSDTEGHDALDHDAEGAEAETETETEPLVAAGSDSAQG